MLTKDKFITVKTLSEFNKHNKETYVNKSTDIIPIANGGTNASDGATGLKNLFADGATILSPYQYGGSIPNAGTIGRVFFKTFSINYVSFGDSIAAGHAINDSWERDYGTDSQYGNNGNTSTAIVPMCYTDLIHKELSDKYGSNNIITTSFAKSGDRVDDLLAKLSDNNITNAVKKASFITICIGANDVLEPALEEVPDYINTGDLSALEVIIDGNLATLDDDDSPTSYNALLSKLTELNPTAKIAFTTIYNPYKYLWIEEGKNGFFAPLLNTIPQMTILGFEVDDYIKEYLLDTNIVQTLFDRVNGLGDWTEDKVTRLNAILRKKIETHVNHNISLADTKIIFDIFPDRPVSAEKHYNDLLNVEYTRGYNTATMDWGRLWEGSNANDFWWNLAEKYVSWSGIDIEGFAAELIGLTIEKIIMPDIDPHPEEYGQYILKCSFLDAFNLKSLGSYTIKFDANGGSGTMNSQTVVGIDGLPAYINLNANLFTPTEIGYRFVGWNTRADGSGTSYSNEQFISINSNITLYAQWSNLYNLYYMHTNHTNLYGNDETGHKESYELYINGELKPKFGTFANSSTITYSVPYGSTIKVAVNDYRANDFAYKNKDARVYYNGSQVAIGQPAQYSFSLTGNTTVDFRWKIAGSLITFDAQSWEDCYITT